MVLNLDVRYALAIKSDVNAIRRTTETFWLHRSSTMQSALRRPHVRHPYWKWMRNISILCSNDVYYAHLIHATRFSTLFIQETVRARGRTAFPVVVWSTDLLTCNKYKSVMCCCLAETPWAGQLIAKWPFQMTLPPSLLLNQDLAAHALLSWDAVTADTIINCWRHTGILPPAGPSHQGGIW